MLCLSRAHLSSLQVQDPDVHESGGGGQGQGIEAVPVDDQDVGAEPLQDVGQLDQRQAHALHHGRLVLTAHDGVQLGADVKVVLLDHAEGVAAVGDRVRL